MPDYSNLVRDSKVTRDLITLLGRRNRTLPLADAAWQTMRMRGVDDARLGEIFANLLGRDPRFEVTAAGVRLAEDPRERAPLGELEFAVVDTETTGGSSAHGHRLTEVAAVRVRDGRVTGRFSTLVNPERAIPPEITRLTGITDAMVRTAPRFEHAAAPLLDFLGDSVIVAHNAPFDRGFLDAELRRAFNRRLLSPFLCTVQLARRVVPGLPSYRLDLLASHFGVRIADRHRALGDAEATGEVFCRLLERLADHRVADLRGARRFRLERP
jgi:DNA polymerase III epsilon subunit